MAQGTEVKVTIDNGKGDSLWFMDIIPALQTPESYARMIRRKYQVVDEASITVEPAHNPTPQTPTEKLFSRFGLEVTEVTE